jgi:hypothetical protein
MPCVQSRDRPWIHPFRPRLQRDTHPGGFWHPSLGFRRSRLQRDIHLFSGLSCMTHADRICISTRHLTCLCPAGSLTVPDDAVPAASIAPIRITTR